ncbi:hypothetical protein CCACVL1_21687, partial [Corchorus capsularis]
YEASRTANVEVIKESKRMKASRN